jgi:hypothetical protein
MNVRWLLLLAICLSSQMAAQAAPSRTFQASIDALTAAQREKMDGRSWHEGCPVPLDDLVSIRFDYVGFGGGGSPNGRAEADEFEMNAAHFRPADFA